MISVTQNNVNYVAQEKNYTFEHKIIP